MKSKKEKKDRKKSFKSLFGFALPDQPQHPTDKQMEEISWLWRVSATKTHQHPYRDWRED